MGIFCLFAVLCCCYAWRKVQMESIYKIWKQVLYVWMRVFSLCMCDVLQIFVVLFCALFVNIFMLFFYGIFLLFFLIWQRIYEKHGNHTKDAMQRWKFFLRIRHCMVLCVCLSLSLFAVCILFIHWYECEDKQHETIAHTHIYANCIQIIPSFYLLCNKLNENPTKRRNVLPLPVNRVVFVSRS